MSTRFLMPNLEMHRRAVNRVAMPRKTALTTRTLPERSARGILSHGLCVVGRRDKVWWGGAGGAEAGGVCAVWSVEWWRA